MNKLACGTVALAISLMAIPASAGDGQAYYPSPKRRDPDSKATMELRFGAYRPQIDAGLKDPFYEPYFGSAPRYMIGIEVDWQAFHIAHFGSIGIGGIVGYTKSGAKAPIQAKTPYLDGRLWSQDVRSEEDVSLSMWMLAAVAVLRIDVLARETWLPIVPYGKFGFGTGLWSFSNGLGTSYGKNPSDAKDEPLGRGRSNGLVYAVGGMLLLDFLDRQSAKTFDAEHGVKHSYFFTEYSIYNLNGLGQKATMNVGDRTWTIGLALEI